MKKIKHKIFATEIDELSYKLSGAWPDNYSKALINTLNRLGLTDMWHEMGPIEIVPWEEVFKNFDWGFK